MHPLRSSRQFLLISCMALGLAACGSADSVSEGANVDTAVAEEESAEAGDAEEAEVQEAEVQEEEAQETGESEPAEEVPVEEEPAEEDPVVEEPVVDEAGGAEFEFDELDELEQLELALGALGAGSSDELGDCILQRFEAEEVPFSVNDDGLVIALAGCAPETFVQMFLSLGGSQPSEEELCALESISTSIADVPFDEADTVLNSAGPPPELVDAMSACGLTEQEILEFGN